MLEEILHEFDAVHKTDLKNVKTLVAVSGGVDSMVLAQLFVKSGFPFAIAHVNFGLRGAESDGDEQLVASFAERHGIQLFITHTDTIAYAEQYGLSVQMAARELRYDFFKKCMRENSFKYLATAHHADDALENFFIYSIRRNTRASLSGISPLHDNLIRPFYTIFRCEIEDYAKQNALIWREDSSNLKSNYLRNKIRRMIIPGLADYYPEVREDFLFLSAGFRNLYHNQDKAFKASVDAHSVSEKWGELFIFDSVRQEKSGEDILRWVFRSNGFHHREIETILGNRTTGSSFMSATVAVYRESKGFRIIQNPKQTERYFFAIGEADLPVLLEAGMFVLECGIIKKAADLEEENTWYFDTENLCFPLTVRSRKTGDRFMPWGGDFSKKLSDLMVNAKIPLVQKGLYPVVEDENAILGAVGLRRSNMAPVTNNSKNILRIKWRPANNTN